MKDINPERGSNIAAFATYTRQGISAGEYDRYPMMLRAIGDAEDLSPDHRMWRLLWVVALYHPAGAEQAWNQYPDPKIITGPARFPTKSERRGFRGNDKAADFMNAAIRAAEPFGGLYAWAADAASAGNPVVGWERVRASMEALPGAGPWTSYKWAQWVRRELNADIRPESMGVAGDPSARGPAQGLAHLTGLPWREAVADRAAQQRVWDAAQAAGAQMDDWADFHTAACGWDSIVKGHEYIGVDMDKDMELLPAGSAWWAARGKVLDPAYLGEVGGWTGVRKHLLSTYADTGALVYPANTRGAPGLLAIRPKSRARLMAEHVSAFVVASEIKP